MLKLKKFMRILLIYNVKFLNLIPFLTSGIKKQQVMCIIYRQSSKHACKTRNSRVNSKSKQKEIIHNQKCTLTFSGGRMPMMVLTFVQLLISVLQQRNHLTGILDCFSHLLGKIFFLELHTAQLRTYTYYICIYFIALFLFYINSREGNYNYDTKKIARFSEYSIHPKFMIDFF